MRRDGMTMNIIKFMCGVVVFAVGVAFGLSLCDMAKNNDRSEEEEKDEWDKFFGH